VVVDKMKRNYQRLKDLSALEKGLDEYAKNNDSMYPALVEGTYLKGQVISTWPSWGSLGSLVGANATDPVNVLGKAGTCSKSTQVFCVADNQCPRGETTS
jgi:hypothetical protein